MERKHKCKYCNKLITHKGGMCSDCEEKYALVKKLLRMVKEKHEREKL